jgi:hypothetical protein
LRRGVRINLRSIVTNKLRLKEFLVITTWLFQLADGSFTMSLQQAEMAFLHL